MSDLCIVVLSYNHPELTARAVRSALQFSNLPLFLVHNGSAPFHVQNLKNQFPEVQHLVLAANRGYSGGVNFGLSAVFQKGFQWAFLLTNDCLIDSLEPPNQKNPGLLAPLIFRRSKEKVDSIGGCFEPRFGKLTHLKSKLEFDLLCSNRKATKSIPYVPGSAFWIHREVFEKIGGMDESLGTYWEDVDFSVRVFQKGFSLGASVGTQVLHSVGKTNHKDPVYTTYYFQRNRKIVSLRHLPPQSWDRLLFQIRYFCSFGQRAFKLYRKKDQRRLGLLKAAYQGRPYQEVYSSIDSFNRSN